MDRGKQGAKRHFIVGRNGSPLVVLNSAINTGACKMFIKALDAVPFACGRVKVHGK